jgi:hypothetical protein
MQRMTGTVVRTGAFALALALAGCGGGGGAGAPAANPPVADAPSPQRTVQGTAAKGLIKGARISVHALDAQGVRAGTALATATTGNDGTYKLQIAASVQNFVIEVGAVPGAVMADEASGTDLALPDSLKLRSVVTLASNAGATYEGTVSPLTEMVARTAETVDGKLPPQAVAQAKASVRTLLGFDPETVKPVNSNSASAATASEDEKNQSLALAAISKMASAVSADCAQSNAGERIACVVAKLAASVTVKDGQPALEESRLAQFRDAIQAVAQDKTINRTGKDKVVGMPVLTPAPAPVPTTPGPAGTPTQIAATKALFSSLRTNLRSIDEGDAFGATADAIKADLNGKVAPLGNDAGGLASLTFTALDLLDRIRAGSSYWTQVEVLNNHVRNSPVLFTTIANGDGTCEIAKSPLSISCTVISNAYLPGTVATSLLAGTRVYATRTFKLEPKEGSTTGYRYTAFLEKRTVQYQGGITVGTPAREAIGGVFTGDATFARSGNAVTQIAVNGRMPGRLNASGTLDSDDEDWLLNVVRTDETNATALYKFGGAFTATRAGQPAGKIEIDDTSFLRVALDSHNNNVLPNAANELQLTLRGIVGSTTVGGTLRILDDKRDKSGTTHVPTRLSFEGSLKHADATVFSGHVSLTRSGYENFDATVAESDTNFVADTIDLGGALSVPNRPALSLTLGATRTGKDTGNISAQYRDGSSVINASVTGKAGERHPLVKVSSADGVAFSFTSTSVPVPVTKDGAVTAQLDLSKGIISYSDGSTESLK